MLTGQEVREWRIARGMTQAELARRLGVTRQTVHAFETGRKQLSPENMALLGAIIGIATGAPISEWQDVSNGMQIAAAKIVEPERSKENRRELLKEVMVRIRQALSRTE